MRRSYFLLRPGQVSVLDEAGIELSDLVEAAEEAARPALEYRGEGKRKDHLAKSDGAVIVEDNHSTGLEVSLRGMLATNPVGTLPEARTDKGAWSLFPGADLQSTVGMQTSQKE